MSTASSFVFWIGLTAFVAMIPIGAIVLGRIRRRASPRGARRAQLAAWALLWLACDVSFCAIWGSFAPRGLAHVIPALLVTALLLQPVAAALGYRAAYDE